MQLPKHLKPPFGTELNDLTEYASIRRYFEGEEIADEDELKITLQIVSTAIDWCKNQILSAPK